MLNGFPTTEAELLEIIAKNPKFVRLEPSKRAVSVEFIFQFEEKRYIAYTSGYVRSVVKEFNYRGKLFDAATPIHAGKIENPIHRQIGRASCRERVWSDV